MQSTPGPLWQGVVAPDRVLSMSQIELFVIQTVPKQMTITDLKCLKFNCLITWLYLNKWLMFNWFVSDR